MIIINKIRRKEGKKNSTRKALPNAISNDHHKWRKFKIFKPIIIRIPYIILQLKTIFECTKFIESPGEKKPPLRYMLCRMDFIRLHIISQFYNRKRCHCSLISFCINKVHNQFYGTQFSSTAGVFSSSFFHSFSCLACRTFSSYNVVEGRFEHFIRFSATELLYENFGKKGDERQKYFG